MTKDEIIKMAKQAGARRSSNPDEYDVMKITYCGLEAFAKRVAEKEREAVIDLVDGYAKDNTDLADAIRARGQE